MVRKNPNTSHVTKDFHWPHRSFRDSVHGVRKWLADVIMSSQALQGNPKFVEFIPSAPGHKIHRLSRQQAQSPSSCKRDSGHLWFGQVHAILEDWQGTLCRKSSQRDPTSDYSMGAETKDAAAQDEFMPTALVVLDIKKAEMHGDCSPTEHRWTSESAGQQNPHKLLSEESTRPSGSEVQINPDSMCVPQVHLQSGKCLHRQASRATNQQHVHSITPKELWTQHTRER